MLRSGVTTRSQRMTRLPIGALRRHLFLILVSLFCIFPFLWMAIGATNTAQDILRGSMRVGDQLSANLNTLFGKYQMGRVLRNSFKVTGFSVILTLLLSSMAAYGFQMYQTRGKQRVYAFFLGTMMVPFATLMIPLFKIAVGMKLINTHLAVILVGSVSVFMIFFFRQSFTSFPMEILQAARVDGAGEIRIFFRIFLPAMRSTFFAAAIYSFMTSWNSYMWPLIVLQTNDKMTTTLLLSSMSSAYVPEYGVIMTGIVLSTLPIIVLFFAFQKQFVQGMLGSVKQ